MIFTEVCQIMIFLTTHQQVEKKARQKKDINLFQVGTCKNSTRNILSKKLFISFNIHSFVRICKQNRHFGNTKCLAKSHVHFLLRQVSGAKIVSVTALHCTALHLHCLVIIIRKAERAEHFIILLHACFKRFQRFSDVSYLFGQCRLLRESLQLWRTLAFQVKSAKLAVCISTSKRCFLQ